MIEVPLAGLVTLALALLLRVKVRFDFIEAMGPTCSAGVLFLASVALNIGAVSSPREAADWLAFSILAATLGWGALLWGLLVGTKGPRAGAPDDEN